MIGGWISISRRVRRHFNGRVSSGTRTRSISSRRLKHKRVCRRCHSLRARERVNTSINNTTRIEVFQSVGRSFSTLSVRVSLPRTGSWRGKFVNATAADTEIDNEVIKASLRGNKPSRVQLSIYTGIES